MEVSTPVGNAHDSSRIIPNMHVSLHKVFSLIIHESPIIFWIIVQVISSTQPHISDLSSDQDPGVDRCHGC